METITSPLPRDIRKASTDLGRDEARYLVDLYYQLQDERIGLKNQARALSSSEEPHATVAHFGAQFEILEKQAASALDAYSGADPLGQWARSQVGVGPVIAAGLLAHIDIAKAHTAGAIWRFAGLDPTVTWGKGERRPYNAKLKVLCWKIGDSFVKQSGRDSCFYGHLYRERKELELTRDDQVRAVPSGVTITPYPEDGPGHGTVVVDGQIVACRELAGTWFYGGNAKAAHQTLQTKKIQDAETLAIYRGGHLPAGRLDLRARRYAVKLFLAHYFEEGWRIMHGTEPPVPYPIAHLGHTHRIEAPRRAA